MVQVGAIGEMATQLHCATDLGAGHQLGTGAAQVVLGQKFLHVLHRRTEPDIRTQQFVTGFNRMAASGGGHQHRVELACQLQFPLVMTDRTPAAQVRRNHHLEAILEGGLAYGGRPERPRLLPL